MPRNATARREPEVADEAATMRVDELIQLGRGQGYLSLTELRAAFGEAGVSPAEGRSIIRELADAGVRLGDEPGGGAAPQGAPSKSPTSQGTASKRARTGTEDMTTAQLTASPTAAGEPALDSLDAAEAEAVALAGAAPAEELAEEVASGTAQPPQAEVDLDDQTSAMGDSVHTYLKSIGRTSLLTAEQEVNLAKRIEAGLFAEHKLATEADLDANDRRDLEEVAEDGRRAIWLQMPVSRAQGGDGYSKVLSRCKGLRAARRLFAARLRSLHPRHFRCDTSPRNRIGETRFPERFGWRSAYREDRGSAFRTRERECYVRCSTGFFLKRRSLCSGICFPR